MKRVRWLVGLMALATLDVAGTGCNSSGRARSSSAVPAAGLASFRYSLDQHLRVATEAQEELASFDLKSELVLSKLGQRGGLQLVRLQLEAPQLDAAGLSPEQRRDYEQALQKPCYYTLNAQGGIAQVYSARGIPSAVQGIWKAMLSALQLQPVLGKGDSWQASERDGAGDYQAAYQRTAPETYSKHKLSYSASSKPEQPQQEVLESDTKFKLDDRGDLTSLAFAEKCRAVLPSFPTFVSESRLRLDRKSTAEVSKPSDLDALLAAQVASQLSDPPSSDARRADTDRQLAKQANTKDLLPALASKEERTRTEAYQRLVALLRVNESTVPEVAKLARSSEAGSSSALVALGDAGTEATAKELAAIVADTAAPAATRQTALQSLGRSELQGKDGSELVVGLLSDPVLGFQAKLSLGSMVFRLKESDPARARTLLQKLEAGALGTTARGEYLKALGNAGHPDSLDTLTKILESPQAQIRAGAVAALRRVPGDAAEALLLKATHDADASVRSAALVSGQEHGRSKKLLEAAFAIAKNDPDSDARLKAIGVIADFGRTLETPASRALLSALADDASVADNVRESARHALEQVGQPS